MLLSPAATPTLPLQGGGRRGGRAAPRAPLPCKEGGEQGRRRFPFTLLPPGQGGGREGGESQRSLDRHSRASGNPETIESKQIPACAGMTGVAGMTGRRRRESVRGPCPTVCGQRVCGSCGLPVALLPLGATPTPTLPLQGRGRTRATEVSIHAPPPWTGGRPGGGWTATPSRSSFPRKRESVSIQWLLDSRFRGNDVKKKTGVRSRIMPRRCADYADRRTRPCPRRDPHTLSSHPDRGEVGRGVDRGRATPRTRRSLPVWEMRAMAMAQGFPRFRGLANARTMPRRVRTSCSMRPAREKMLRMLRTIAGRFSGGCRNPPASSSRSR